MTFLAACFLTALTGGLALPLIGSAGAAGLPPDGDRLRVITFNVAGIPIIDGTRPARLAAIAAELGRAGHDIALFQEVWLDKDAKLLEKEGRFSHRVRRGGGLFGNGLLILSRGPIVEKARRVFTVKSRGSKDDWIERGVLAARVATPHGNWDVYTTHLTHVRDAATVRLAQVFELSEFIKEFSGERPFLLGGDFNFTPESVEARVLRGLLGAQDSCLGAEGERCGATSPESGRRIDFLFAADAGSLSPATSFKGTFAHEGAALAYSDHLALEAALDPALLRVAARPHPDHEAWALGALAEALGSEIRRLRESSPVSRDDHRFAEDPQALAFESILERIGRKRIAPAAPSGGVPAPLPEEVIRAAAAANAGLRDLVLDLELQPASRELGETIRRTSRALAESAGVLERSFERISRARTAMIVDRQPEPAKREIGGAMAEAVNSAAVLSPLLEHRSEIEAIEGSDPYSTTLLAGLALQVAFRNHQRALLELTRELKNFYWNMGALGLDVKEAAEALKQLDHQALMKEPKEQWEQFDRRVAGGLDQAPEEFRRQAEGVLSLTVYRRPESEGR